MGEAIDDLHGEPGVAPVATASAPEGVGALLRARRLELGMSPADVGASVKLTARRIVALEEERWQELPSGPYLRGLLRNVARTLHMEADTLLARVDASLVQIHGPDILLLAPSIPHAIMPRRGGRLDDRRNSRGWVLGAVVFALLAAAIAWSGTDSFDRTLTASRALFARTPPVATVTTSPESDSVAPLSPVDPPATVADAAVATAPVVEASGLPALTVAPAVEGAAAAALVFHFNEDSWVEVKAADGKILTQRLNNAGSDQTIAGTPPFSLIVGNAKGVALRYHGQSVDLGPHTRDEVARLTLP